MDLPRASAEPAAPPSIHHPVIAVGASAGGLEALQEFFGNLPIDLGASYVVVQHLSPDYRSMLDELISRHTQMPVQVVADGCRLEPDSIYIIPPAHNLECEGDRLRLRDQPGRRVGRLNLAIDTFFTSLATQAQELATAVILSGTGSDGSAGLIEVSENGGIVMVQEPATAKFDGMPVSAIQTGLADVIGSPARLASRVAEHLRHPIRATNIGADQDGATNEILDQVTTLLGTKFDVHLEDYKPTTMLRRIARRVPLTQSPSLVAYLDRLHTDPEEQRALLDDLLIGVTSFFRDPERWEALFKLVLKPWAESDQREERRAWVCACSTGEEAYTLSMLVAEAFDLDFGQTPPVRIFATDISKDALQIASTAIYPRTIEQMVSPERLSRFFEKLEGDHYRVRSEIRRTVVFAPHDVTRQTPFSRMDLVTCRNVLIYMQPELQNRVLSLLHYALLPNGALFLGSAEGLLDLTDLFQPLDTKARIFASQRQSTGLPSTQLRVTQPSIELPPPPRARRDSTKTAQEFLLDSALSALLTQEDASALLVSRSDNLVRVLGQTPEFLRLPVGVPTNEVKELLPRNLSLSVATALHRARTENEHVWIRNVHFMLGNAQKTVDVSATPLSSLRPDIEVDLVTFRSSREPLATTAVAFDIDEAAQQRVGALERELAQSRENLQATIEELETTNEEQQATNEELLASNEELQSTNEELHSVNEELHTVNTDYQTKIEQLVDLNAALDGLLNALDVGIVFLSAEGQVIRYNETATRVFRLTRVDLNRPLMHLTDTMAQAEDRVHLAQAIQHKAELRMVAPCATGTWRLRVQALEGEDNQGRMILTMFDVTDFERARLDLARQSAMMETIARELPDVLWVIGTDGNYEYVSDGYQRLWGQSPQWASENPEAWISLIHPEDQERVVHAVTAGLNDQSFDVQYRIVREDGSVRWARGRGFAVVGTDGQRLCTIGTIQDITEAVQRDEEQQQLLRRFERTVLALGEVAYDRDLRAGTVAWRGDVFDAFGYREHSVGDDRSSWLKRVHPNDVERVEAEFARALCADGRAELRYRFQRADGTYAWVHDRSYLMGDGDRIDRVVGVMEVINDNLDHSADARVGHLIDALGGASWSWNSSTDAWTFDGALLAWVGGADPEARLKSAFLDRVHGSFAAGHAVRALVGSETDPNEEILMIAAGVPTSSGGVLFEGQALAVTKTTNDMANLRRQSEALAGLDDAVSMFPPDGTTRVWANTAAEQLSAVNVEPDLIEQALLRRLKSNGGRVVQSERVIEHETLGPRVLASSRRRLRDGTVLAVDRDITDRREAERSLRRRASVDALTGLFLRSRFLEAIDFEVARSSRQGASGFAVVFMDLDGFKEVNDSYDHFVGNELLKAFADRLRTLFRPADTVARFGGDEFAVLVEDVGDYRDALAVARRIHAANLAPLAVGDRHFTVSASIGIAVWDPSRHSPESILRDADVAMYEAKRREQDKTVVFDAQMHARVLLRHETKRDLHEAIGRGEFELFLQPISRPDGARMGFETLLRWRHPQRGLLTPGAFLELAAEAGEMLDLEAWVLAEVLRIVDAYGDVFTVERRPTLSVNATPGLLRSHAFSAWLDRIREEEISSRVDLVVEIVEETMIDGDPAVRLAVERATDAGIRIAVDDFGTGYSSLSYLIHWPVDIIKLDGTFAQRGTRDLRGDMVVCALVDLARSLGITTILEGVESLEQLEFARSVKVDAVQGFHLGRPKPPGVALAVAEA